jgi:hypothetical protein
MDDDSIPIEELQSPPRPARPWSQRPFALMAVAIVLLVGGWKLASFVPGDDRFAAWESMTDSEDERQALRRFRGHAAPPYQVPGRLIFAAGALVFGAAVVGMARGPQSPTMGRPPAPGGGANS